MRHPLILRLWELTPVNDYFVIENDHNPLPLRMQFPGRDSGCFSWEYLDRGPETFRIKVTRLRGDASSPSDPTSMININENEICHPNPAETDRRGSLFSDSPLASAPNQKESVKMNEPSKHTGAEITIRLLERQRIRHIAGMPGGANLPLYDALFRSTQIRHVFARHEQGAGFIAQGMARISGRPEVCFATSLPGCDVFKP